MIGPKLDYLLDAKLALDSKTISATKWDFFISAFNETSRVQAIFKQVSATTKAWWSLPEYGYDVSEIAAAAAGGKIVTSNEEIESDFVIDCMTQCGICAGCSGSICIDITGLMRPHILVLLRYLEFCGIKHFHMLYTEPEHYSKKAETKFSLDETTSVRQVKGFEGVHNADMTNDYLIVGIGYDHRLIGQVIQSKDSARLVELHSLPSLSADMYHESILRLDQAAGAPEELADDQLFFSSANDPYVTATSLSEIHGFLSKNYKPTNIYLTPLATKPQALGFGIFYIKELTGQPASIVFPFSKKYDKETSKGIGRTWLYPIRL